MEFLHNIELEVRAFFFNAATDYLPYYKNFTFSINKNDRTKPLKDLLPMIKEQNPMFAYPVKDLLFRVNDLVVTGEESLMEVVDQLGTQLTIDPALKFRSDNGLILNNHDFLHQFRTIFKRHEEDKEDLAYYISLYPVHYASETFNYNHEYIGDAILITAAHMIEKHPQYKAEILAAINDEFNGIVCCEYENHVFNGIDYSETIASLKKEIKVQNTQSLLEKITASCLKKMKKPLKVNSIEEKNIALYIGSRDNSSVTEIHEQINNVGQLITFNMATKLAGQTLMDSNPTLAHQKAGTMLLDAFDSGAEVLVCANDEDCEIFQKALGEIESEMGWEIGMALLPLSQFQEMSSRIEA